MNPFGLPSSRPARQRSKRSAAALASGFRLSRRTLVRPGRLTIVVRCTRPMASAISTASFSSASSFAATSRLFPIPTARQTSTSTHPRLETAVRIGVALLCHKFHLWLRGRRRRQHGHRERAFAIAKASARRIVAIELGTCRCGRSGGASGSVITGKGIFFDWSGGTWS